MRPTAVEIMKLPKAGCPASAVTVATVAVRPWRWSRGFRASAGGQGPQTNVFWDLDAAGNAMAGRDDRDGVGAEDAAEVSS